jgi:hypothetical protein
MLTDHIEELLRDEHQKKSDFSLIVFTFYNKDRSSLFKNSDGTLNLIKYSVDTNKTHYLAKRTRCIEDIFTIIEDEPNLIHKVLIYKRYGKTNVLTTSSARKKHTNNFIVK